MEVRSFLGRALVPVAALSSAVASLPAHALAAADLETMMASSTTLLSTTEGKLLALGGIIIGFAIIGAGVKWILGMIFK